MIKSYLLLVLVICAYSAKAQNIAINETGAAPDPSAMLDITSSNKGILIPRLPDQTIIAAPVEGLLVYNTTDDGFWYFDGTQWIPLLGGNLGWRIVGNDGTDPVINFLGTTDEQPLMIRVNNQSAGRIDWMSELAGSVIGRKGVTAIGNNALSGNTSGRNNTAFGFDAGSTLTTGSQNTLVGSQAGLNIAGTSDNTFVGHQSGYLLTTGATNTAIGTMAGRQMTSANRNTYVGFEAGNGNVTGNDNVCVGYFAGGEGPFNGGNDNVCVGSLAGRYLTESNGNVMVGYQAGEQNRTGGFNNTFVGYRSGKGGNNEFETPGPFNAFLGHNSGKDCINCQRNVFVGQAAGEKISSGQENVFLGRRAGFNMLSGSGNILIGNRAGEFLAPTTSNRLVIANNLNQADALITGDFATNQVGINTFIPSQTLSVNGSAGKTDGPDWSVFSDERVKKNVKAFNDGLNVVMQLRPVRFQYKENSGVTDTDNEFIGFVAQDVEKVAPYMVNLYDDSNGPSGYSDKRVLNTSALNQILVNALQEQQQKIEDLESRLQRIENLLLEKNENATAEKH